MTTTTRRDPWDRRDTESDPAWQAFVIYRDMGLERGNAKVARELGKSKALMDRWSRAHQWVVRASAYDAEEDRQHRISLRVARRKAAERNLKIAAAAMNTAAGGLQHIANDPSKLKAQDVARLMEVASRLEALVLGQATEIVQAQGPAGGPVQVDVGSLTDEERHARMLMLRRELDTRLNDAGVEGVDDESD